MTYAPLPIDDEFAIPDPSERDHPLAKRLPKFLIGTRFIRWFSGLSNQVDQRPARRAHARDTDAAAAVATTALAIDTVQAGVYQVLMQVRVVTPASVSSEVRGTVSWTQGGAAQSEQTTLLNGNLATTREGKTFVVRPDPSTPISFAFSYASVGTAMVYEYDVIAIEAALGT